MEKASRGTSDFPSRGTLVAFRWQRANKSNYLNSVFLSPHVSPTRVFPRTALLTHENYVKFVLAYQFESLLPIAGLWYLPRRTERMNSFWEYSHHQPVKHSLIQAVSSHAVLLILIWGVYCVPIRVLNPSIAHAVTHSHYTEQVVWYLLTAIYFQSQCSCTNFSSLNTSHIDLFICLARLLQSETLKIIALQPVLWSATNGLVVDNIAIARSSFHESWTSTYYLSIHSSIHSSRGWRRRQTL